MQGVNNCATDGSTQPLMVASAPQGAALTKQVHVTTEGGCEATNSIFQPLKAAAGISKVQSQHQLCKRIFLCCYLLLAVAALLSI
jgi:hypothetical protein